MNNDIKNNTELYELIHYAQNKLTDKQRNEIERAFERDKFLEEAYQGMAKYKSNEIISDLHSVDFVHGRKSKVAGTKFIYVLLLIIAIAGLVYFFGVEKELFKKQPATIVTKPQKLFAVDDDTLLDTPVVTDSLIADTNHVTATDTSFAISNNILQQKEKSTETIKRDKKESETPQTIKTDASIQDTLQLDTTLPAEKTKSPSMNNVKHSDDQNKTKPTSILQNNNEESIDTKLQTLQSNVKISETDSIAQQTHDAMPEGGFKAFNRYVQQNIQYPASESTQTIQQVNISFEIDRYGRPHKYNVNRAPSNADFQNEAIRLLREGPKWSPAVDQGETISNKASVQIVFTPDSI